MAELNLLQEKILSDGVIRPGNVLKVDSFLNHQIDVPFISELGKEFKKLFGDRKVDKILTIEASGIGIACLTAVFNIIRQICPCRSFKKSRILKYDQSALCKER